ncbi:MAG: hypothetical protein ACO3AG_00735 [Fluviibacter sp.]
MSDIRISLVPYDRTMETWGAVEHFMEAAAEATYGRYTKENILEAILHHDYNLWVVFNDERLFGALVTALKLYPQKKMLELSFIGGEEGPTWKDKMLDLMQRWAYDNNCDGIEACARFGWAKIFKDDGYRPLWQTFELPMGAEGLGE